MKGRIVPEEADDERAIRRYYRDASRVLRKRGLIDGRQESEEQGEGEQAEVSEEGWSDGKG